MKAVVLYSEAMSLGLGLGLVRLIATTLRPGEHWESTGWRFSRTRSGHVMTCSRMVDARLRILGYARYPEEG